MALSVKFEADGRVSAWLDIVSTQRKPGTITYSYSYRGPNGLHCYGNTVHTPDYPMSYLVLEVLEKVAEAEGKLTGVQRESSSGLDKSQLTATD